MNDADRLAARAQYARAELAKLRGGGNRFLYTDEQLAQLPDEEALLDADAFAITIPGTRVHVDVIAPGVAIIVGGGHQARVGVNPAQTGTRFYVEDTDGENTIGYARTFRQAGELFAAYFELPDPHIVVDRENG